MLRSLVFVLLALLVAGCSRGPGGSELVEDVQARLDALFGGQVLLLRDLNRQGSAPFAAAADGAKQAIVYYNATLEFAEPYDPSDWEGLSPQLIATALGATDEGLVGFGAGRMAPGSELRAYGSIVYRREGDAWQVTDPQLPQPPTARTTGGGARSSRANELIQRLAALVDTSPGLRGAHDEIVAEELDRALQNIQLRLDRGADHFVVATGPAGGEYQRFVDSIAARLQDPERLSAATTEGSVANALLVDGGKARFGLVQSDVAAAAVTGDGIFAATGPLRHLSAVASLFPETLHVIVRADAGIDAIAGLAGRRISLGDAGSGTRHTAVQVLAAHGLSADSYVDVGSEEPGEALRQLASGTVDAVIVVAAAPWMQLSTAAGDGTLRLLPLDPAAVERIVAEAHGLIPLAIPARTYPGQEHPVRSVAATALLVTSTDTPDVIVTGALQSIFATGDAPARGVTDARLSRERGRTGVTIPLHDGAAAYFEREPANR